MSVPTYSKRLEKLWKILEILALNKEVYQNKLGDLVSCSYRTAMRQLQLLSKLGLARVVRTEPSSKRGKDRNIWGITFEGILEVLSLLLHREVINKIAQTQKDKWLVFQEWDSLVKDPEIKGVVVLGIRTYSSSKAKILRARTDLKKVVEFSKILTQTYKEIFAQIEEMEKTEATLKALHLDLIFTYKAWPPWIDDPNHTLVRLWKICWSNQRIREFMKRQFEYEKLKHQYLLKFEEFFDRLP